MWLRAESHKAWLQGLDRDQSPGWVRCSSHATVRFPRPGFTGEFSAICCNPLEMLAFWPGSAAIESSATSPSQGCLFA
jgi:hypothetical protein